MPNTKGFKTPFTNYVVPKAGYEERPTNGTDPKAKVEDTNDQLGKVRPKELPFNSLKH